MGHGQGTREGTAGRGTASRFGRKKRDIRWRMGRPCLRPCLRRFCAARRWAKANHCGLHDAQLVIGPAKKKPSLHSACSASSSVEWDKRNRVAAAEPVLRADRRQQQQPLSLPRSVPTTQDPPPLYFPSLATLCCGPHHSPPVEPPSKKLRIPHISTGKCQQRHFFTCTSDMRAPHSKKVCADLMTWRNAASSFFI